MTFIVSFCDFQNSPLMIKMLYHTWNIVGRFYWKPETILKNICSRQLQTFKEIQTVDFETYWKYYW